MWKKIVQRLSDPIFYQRRLALVSQLFGKKKVEPLSLDALTHDRVLVVVAHPDDEVFCSGLLFELREKFQTELHLLCLTKGEGGPLPDGICRENLGDVRVREMKRSCEILGIEKLTFLDHVDPVGTEFRSFPPAVSVDQLAEQIRKFIDSENPDWILTHGSWGEYWHPAHLLLHRAVMRMAEKKIPVVTFKARQENPSISKIVNHADPPNFQFDFTEHFQKRLAALEAHETQLSLFAQFSGTTHEDFVRLTSQENYAVKNLPVSAS